MDTVHRLTRISGDNGVDINEYKTCCSDASGCSERQTSAIVGKHDVCSCSMQPALGWDSKTIRSGHYLEGSDESHRHKEGEMEDGDS